MVTKKRKLADIESVTKAGDLIGFLNKLAPSCKLLDFRDWKLPHQWRINDAVTVFGYHFPQYTYAWKIVDQRKGVKEYITENEFEVLEMLADMVPAVVKALAKPD